MAIDSIDNVATTTTTATENVTEGMDTNHKTTTTASSSTTGKEGANNKPSSSPLFNGQHPSLETFCAIDCQTKLRIVPNDDEPVKIHVDNECFEGYYYFMIRTPDVDEKNNKNNIRNSKKGNNNNSNNNNNNNMKESAKRISKYMKGKKRRFEFQFQLKFKKLPKGPWFLGCEVEHPIEISRFVKSLASVLLAMCRRINPGFHYSWGNDQSSIDNGEIPKDAFVTGQYEKSHVSFPVEASMDRIVISKPGETIPTLGHELYESKESIKKRRKKGFGSVPWNTTDTYTMCLWSAYFDWIEWKAMNVPGVRPFSLSSATGTQPVYLCVYELPNITPTEYKKIKPPHKRCDISEYSRIEFTNVNRTIGGICDEIDAFDRSSNKEEGEGEAEGETKVDDEATSEIFTHTEDISTHNHENGIGTDDIQDSIHGLKDCEDIMDEMKISH